MRGVFPLAASLLLPAAAWAAEMAAVTSASPAAAAGVSAASATAAAAASPALASPPLNVLYLIVDDLRPEFTRAYNQSGVLTPNLDKLAASALVFDRAFCQQAVCGPTRNSFMSGRRPHHTLVFDNDKSFRDVGRDARGVPGANWTTLPQHFKQRGYLTLGGGKTFHPNHPTNWDLPFSWSDDLCVWLVRWRWMDGARGVLRACARVSALREDELAGGWRAASLRICLGTPRAPRDALPHSCYFELCARAWRSRAAANGCRSNDSTAVGAVARRCRSRLLFVFCIASGMFVGGCCRWWWYRTERLPRTQALLPVQLLPAAVGVAAGKWLGIDRRRRRHHHWYHHWHHHRHQRW